jgi:hypothetical protein
MSHMLFCYQNTSSNQNCFPSPPSYTRIDFVETDMLHGFGNYDCCSYTIYSSLKFIKSMDAGYIVCVAQ